MRGALAFLWIYIAAVSALLPERSGVLELLARCGFAGPAGQAMLALSCTLNLGLGLLLLARPSPRLYAVQCLAVIGYTAVAAFNVPALTIDHCGPLLKNVPILAYIVALWLDDAGRPPLDARSLRRSSGRSRFVLREGAGWRPAPASAGRTLRAAALQ